MLHSIADRLQAIQRRNFYQLAAEASHRGRYYHEYSMSVDVTRDGPTWQSPSEDAEEIVTEAMRDLARWLYRPLQAEYDRLTSDEAIEEGIIVNEYTFTAEGRRFWVRGPAILPVGMGGYLASDRTSTTNGSKSYRSAAFSAAM
jgi:TRAP-type C4-dicarboxylate transport system substrate-binding protein